MLKFNFRLCLAVILMIQIDCPVYAEWIALKEQYQPHPLQTIYIDRGSLRRDGNVVTLSALIDWKAMQGGRAPTRFYSTTLTKQLDCVEKRVRTLASTDFYGHMGTGEVMGGRSHMGEGPWVSIDLDSLNYGLWEAVCGKR